MTRNLHKNARPQAMRATLTEILIVLALSFGISGVRSVLRLIDDLLNPAPLNEQSVTINSSQSVSPWLDLGLQLCSAAVLFSWGALALYLLSVRNKPAAMLERFPRVRDWLQGAGLAALIGLPGLALYYSALHFGWTKEVVPTSFDNAWVEMPVLLLKSAANAFAEEVVVVYWFMTRLRQSGLAACHRALSHRRRGFRGICPAFLSAFCLFTAQFGTHACKQTHVYLWDRCDFVVELSA